MTLWLDRRCCSLSLSSCTVGMVGEELEKGRRRVWIRLYDPPVMLPFKGKRALQFAGDCLVGLYRFCRHLSYHFFFRMFMANRSKELKGTFCSIYEYRSNTLCVCVFPVHSSPIPIPLVLSVIRCGLPTWASGPSHACCTWKHGRLTLKCRAWETLLLKDSLHGTGES